MSVVLTAALFPDELTPLRIGGLVLALALATFAISRRRSLRNGDVLILLGLALFLLSSYLWRMYVVSTISDTYPWGFPLQFYMAWGPCPPEQLCSESSFFFLILDLVFFHQVIFRLFERAHHDVNQIVISEFRAF